MPSSNSEWGPRRAGRGFAGESPSGPVPISSGEVTIPRTILVPVDGSHFAEHALPYGIAIARHTGAALHVALVHVPTEVSAPAYPLAEVLEARALEDRDREAGYMEGLVERLRSAGVTVHPALLRGHVSDALSHYVDEQEIDVVVMTTHGRGGLQRAWLGSTTDGMVRHCRVPLLLIRPSDQTREIGPPGDIAFHRILAALDGSETAERALAGAVRLGITADATVTLLHVMQPAVPAATPYLPHTIQLTQDEMAAREAHHRGYLESVAGSAALAGREVQTRLMVDYEPAAAVLDVAEADDADLIVVGTHGRGGLRRMLLGSVADKVIRGTQRAVLVHRGTGGLARVGAVMGRSTRRADAAEGAAGV
jgi:nucleotide-binding universal stress UspA family protein